MNRRQFTSISGPTLAVLIGMAHARAIAVSLGDLTNAEASQGLKTALEKGALAAVDILGKADGFWGNDKVRIRLPEAAPRSSPRCRRRTELQSRSSTGI